MPVFGSKPPDPRKTFEARIERFLEANGVSGTHFWSRDDSLEALFNLVRDTQTDLSKARSKIRKNQDAHDVAIYELQGKIGEKESEIHHLKDSHEKKIESIYEQKNREISTMKRNHHDETSKMRSDRDLSEATLMSKHEEHKNKLINQLLVNVDESQEWPDDKIKDRFGELQRLINSTASPGRRELNFPPDGDISKEIDPNGFFLRGNPRARGHFLVKGVLWDIIKEQFFRLPFGLGAFGPGDTHKSILKALDDWKALTAGNSTRTEDSDLSIFETDSLSNRWRCLTFQYIQSNCSDERSGSSYNTIPKRRKENIAESHARIVSYLSCVAALSNSTLPMEVETEVKRITELAQEIALQFGVHSCKFIWVSPDPDCKWDPAPGLIKCVLKQGGDTSQRTIVQCKGKAEG